ncbi:MAG: SDR family NAD(P)-dependent oxidoreductase [Phycisphaerales bacterium]|nr:SDR family NAD(P)-dependent oxidoreductase [Phycisphaerales bacterium]
MRRVELRGLPIAITGASSGIGRATALACARAGMPVAVAARREARLGEVVAEIERAGGRAIAVRADVDDPEDCRRLVDRTIDAFGSIYAAYANAGYGLEQPIHLTSDAEARAIFETNFWGTVHTLRAALPPMLEAGRGHLLVCSSCLAKMGTPLHGYYSATKAAQDHVARAMRIELAGSGVFVSSVHPIGTRTEFTARKSEMNPERPPTKPPMMQDASVVASATVRCLRRPRGEVWTSLPARLLFALGCAAPGLADRAMMRWMRRTER